MMRAKEARRTMIARTLALAGTMTMAAAFVMTAALEAQPAAPPAPPANTDWPVWGHDPGGQRFSPLADVNRANVGSLKVAWTFRTGDAYQPAHSKPTAFETTPLYVDGTLYLSTPLGRILALDPVTGRQRWAFDAKIDKDAGYGDYATRGVSTWKPAAGPRRIFLATIDAHLIAVDAATGKPCADFGDNGVVDLRRGLRIPPRADRYADYEVTSPPAVAGDTIVVGSGIADNDSVNQPSGEVRGFDAVTGKLLWTWDPIPQNPKAPGAETWKNGSAQRTGAANAWSVIVADPESGLVFVPTGSASPDYYGGERQGNNRDANSLVALRAKTGERVWAFQTVHHDLWDYDVASPPVLFDVHRDGRTIPAVGIGSKSGNFFILNRATGEPVFGVEERPVPKSDVPGEEASPTQPFPVAPRLPAQQKMNVDEIQGSESDRKWCREQIAKLRSEGVFTPPSLRGSLMIPGNVGGMSWSGAAYDPVNRLLLIPVNNLAAQVRLIPRADFDKERETEGRDLSGGWEFSPQTGTPYGMARRFLRAPGGVPCTPPPWGTLNAIDADTGAVKWSVPSGQIPALGPGPAPPPQFGSISLGGPMVTAGGLVFMAGTLDPALRAYDVATGKELWKGGLPVTARAMPMTFRGPDGKQYVVISAGGHGPPITPVGDYVIAFTLGQ
jgi:quinoprotein glucose dehydrogenase